MLIINVVIIFCFLNIVNSSTCFQALLKDTQSCKNQKLLYFHIQGSGPKGHSQGFGSEFNHNFIYSLITAVTLGRRFIYVKSRLDWEYDCPTRDGWACYVRFPCDDSVIQPHEIDLKQPFFDTNGISRDFGQLLASINKQANHDKSRWRARNQTCDVLNANPTTITSIAAQYLYQLNEQSLDYIKRFNAVYGLEHSKYIAVQLRSTDKQAEMDEDVWEWVHNMENVASAIVPYATREHISTVFVSTDQCSLLSELIAKLPRNISVVSPCLKKKMATSPHYTGEHKLSLGGFDPRQRDHRSTLRLLAEIHLWTRAQHFFGVMNSNLVRLVARLRWPAGIQPLAAEMTDRHVEYRLDQLLD